MNASTNASAGVDLSAVSKPEPKRNQYGHYLIPDGQKGKKAGTRAYRRVSTVAKVLDEQGALTAWGERMVAKGVASDESLLQMAATHDPDVDKATFRSITSKAKEVAGSTGKRDLGTAVHRTIEQWLDGAKADQLYAGHRPHIAALQEEIERKGYTIPSKASERIVVLDDLGLAGTVDILPLILPCGTPVIGDLKTGSIGDYSWLSWSIQLAAYAHHDATYDPATDKRGKRIEVSTDKAVVLHLPSRPDDDGNIACTSWEVDTYQGYSALLVALDVEEIRKSSKGTGQYRAWGQRYSPLSTGDVRGWLAERIQAIADHPSDAINDLVAAWPEGVPTPLPPTFEPGQPDALDVVLSKIEALHGLPIASSPPGRTIKDRAS